MSCLSLCVYAMGLNAWRVFELHAYILSLEGCKHIKDWGCACGKCLELFAYYVLRAASILKIGDVRVISVGVVCM